MKRFKIFESGGRRVCCRIQNVQLAAGISYGDVGIVARSADIDDWGGRQRILPHDAALRCAPHCHAAGVGACIQCVACVVEGEAGHVVAGLHEVKKRGS